MGYEVKQLTVLLKEICDELGLEFKSFSDNWIVEITSETGKKALIYGYKFPNNDTGISKICDDKAGLSCILESNSIPKLVANLYFIEDIHSHTKEHMDTIFVVARRLRI